MNYPLYFISVGLVGAFSFSCLRLDSRYRSTLFFCDRKPFYSFYWNEDRVMQEVDSGGLREVNEEEFALII